MILDQILLKILKSLRIDENIFGFKHGEASALKWEVFKILYFL